MKYRIAFTITSETLFSVLSKLFHGQIEDLAVEEAELPPQPKLSSGFKPSRARLKSRKRTTPFDLNGGMNKIVLDLLAQRPHKIIELREPFRAAGYSPNSIASRMARLRERALIKSTGQGFWSLVSDKLVSDKQSLSETKEKSDAPA